jgi:glycosyltransferase involved in cell wall biosynthesis
MTATITVIIPTYNRADTIQAAVQSALTQTCPVAEVLVCDDGSEDNSQEVVALIGDDRVQWLPGRRSGGPAAPRNAGARSSSGQWLAFLDSDDAWLPHKIERQLARLQGTDFKACSTNALRVSTGATERPPYFEAMPQRASFSDMLRCNPVIGSSALVHHSLFDTGRVSFPETTGMGSYADYACWLRVAAQTDWALVEEPLVLYRDEPQLSMRVTDPDPWALRREVFEDFIGWCADGAATMPQLAALSDQTRAELRRDSWRRRLSTLRIAAGALKRGRLATT